MATITGDGEYRLRDIFLGIEVLKNHEFDLIVVRPGLVYGQSPGGMVGALNRLLALPFPVLPMVGLGKHSMLLVHENDLGELIVKICSEQQVPIGRPIIASAEQAKTFRDIMQVPVRVRGKKVLFVPYRGSLSGQASSLPKSWGFVCGCALTAW